MQRVNAQVANRLFATFEVAGAPDFPEKHHCHKPQQVETSPDDNCHISITNRCVRNSAIMISALNLVASGTHTVTSSYFGQIRLKRLSYSIRSVAPGRS
jgi:hypothetical protein